MHEGSGLREGVPCMRGVGYGRHEGSGLWEGVPCMRVFHA